MALPPPAAPAPCHDFSPLRGALWTQLHMRQAVVPPGGYAVSGDRAQCPWSISSETTSDHSLQSSADGQNGSVSGSERHVR